MLLAYSWVRFCVCNTILSILLNLESREFLDTFCLGFFD
ncbi:hypothetical protein O77CONTIG1_02549 [Leptolyngbya sp. O-77]|nr:hypothetical protein O77CONTIG1_02549 [Leptolyngbya sp. O-77]